jgi:hypothetical protein
MATTLVAIAQKKEIEPLFSAEVHGARLARALDALAALEACVRADRLRGPVATETAPFVRPHEGSLNEADTLTWRFYHMNAGCEAHAINSAACGTTLARALYAGLFGYPHQTLLDDAKTKKRTNSTSTMMRRKCFLSRRRVCPFLLRLL